MLRHDRQSGVVLAMVLILGLLLSTAVVTFSRRSMIDGMIARNRDRAARAEALARGGIQVAIGLILEDALLDAEGAEEGAPGRGDTLEDIWASIADTQLETPDGDTLQISIRDTSALLNLNSLVDYARDDDSGLEDQTDAEEFLAEFLGRIIEGMEFPPREDARDLGRNLIDFIDPDEVRVGGRGSEDNYYQQQTPPYRALNQPLISVAQLARIEGFDDELVRALRPYVTVYPAVGAEGINLNTAPPHVLTAVFHGSSGNMRLIKDSDVERILKMRDEGRIICDQTETDPDRCIPLGDVLDGSIYPPTSLPTFATVFEVTARATVGELSRTLDAVIDRGQPAQPRVLRWRYR